MNQNDKAHPTADRLSALFRPTSVAVVGASRKRGTIGGEIFHNLIAQEFNGPVYPVNPQAPVVQSVRAFASLRDVPDPVDLAIVVVPSVHVGAAIDDCIEKGVRALVVISAGFAETGDKGRALQNEILARVRRAGIRMVGPNCLGLLNTAADVRLNATFAPAWPPSGGVAFSSQSGALGLAILDLARDLGIGISQFISVGNKADVSGNDLLEYWEADPSTRVILFYLESLGRPGRFMNIARRVARKKPIVVVKSGRTEAGARAASSHTGSLAGMDVAVDALFGQAGVIRTDTIEELFDVAMLLAHQPVPRGPRVAILTNAGGPGIMAADACESRGLALPALEAATEKALRAFLPPEASVRNPVDMIASAPASAFGRALGLLLRDRNVDSVIVLFVPPIVTGAADVATSILEAAAGATKPIVTCFMGTHGIPEALSSLRHGHLPSYAFPEAGVIALSRAVAYGRWLAQPEGTIPTLSGVDSARAASIVRGKSREGAGWLDPTEVADVLACYGLALPASEAVTSASAAATAAARLAFPVALKLVSSTILHKTDVGGVVLGLTNEQSVRDAYEAMERRLAHEGRAGEMEGALVQQMIAGGVETFIGVTHDASFGPLIAFGLGGINVEVWRDVVFRVHPISDRDATAMIEQVRGRRLLDGYRGSAPADREALRDALLRISRMVTDLPEIREIDINPLLALHPGRGVVAVDARIRIDAVAAVTDRARLAALEATSAQLAEVPSPS